MRSERVSLTGALWRLVAVDGGPWRFVADHFFSLFCWRFFATTPTASFLVWSQASFLSGEPRCALGRTACLWWKLSHGG